MEVPKIDISDSADDSSSDRNEKEHTGNGIEYHNEVAHLPFNGLKNELKQQSMKQSINNDKSYDEEDSFIKLLSEDDDPVNTDTDSDVRPNPVETEELDMITNIPPVIKHLSRSADIRKSRSVSPTSESENPTDGNLSSRDIKNGCDIHIQIQGTDGKIISESNEFEDTLPSILLHDNSGCTAKKDVSNATKRVSFEHSAMLRSACVEGNLDLVKSLNFNEGRDIEGKTIK